MQQTKVFFGISSFALHLLAMVFMLCDHMWAASVVSLNWFCWLGRLAYPIFAFMIVEGYFHTHNFKKYAQRMFLWALISEIPFNLFYISSPVYPFHQNVLWTFLIGLFSIRLFEKIQKRGKLWLTLIGFAIIVVFSYFAGFLLMVDYFGYGILMIWVFYLFRGHKWWCYPAQLLCMFYINWEMIRGLSFPIMIGGREFMIVQQGIACLALLPIWLYDGRQGPYNKWIQLSLYAFYPIHMLILTIPRLFW